MVRRLLAVAVLLEASRARKRHGRTGWRQTLRDWVHRYNAEGVAGVSSRTAPGPSHR